MNEEQEKELKRLTEQDLKELRKCQDCKTPFIPDNTALNFISKKWDGHTWKPNCRCYKKNYRISIG